MLTNLDTLLCSPTSSYTTTFPTSYTLASDFPVGLYTSRTASPSSPLFLSLLAQRFAPSRSLHMHARIRAHANPTVREKERDGESSTLLQGSARREHFKRVCSSTRKISAFLEAILSREILRVCVSLSLPLSVYVRVCVRVG